VRVPGLVHQEVTLMAVGTVRAGVGVGKGGENVARIPAHVAAAAARAIAEGPRVTVEAPPVALELLEDIVVEADLAMTRLATGEALRGTAALGRIRNLARAALRLSRDTAAS
jgi:bifunctional DNase/RNase